MAGHNKWSKIKRIKAVTDARKSALYAKYIKEITVAAKLGGADPDGNFRLKKAIADAKQASVPKDNIERALKKAAGDEGGDQLEEITYEGYGPGGVAFLVECVTDKKTRTQPELRKIFEKSGGNIAEAGAVAWNFNRKGIILMKSTSAPEAALMELALTAGAEDVAVSEEGFEVSTDATNFQSVLQAIEEKSWPVEFSEIAYVPLNRIAIDSELETKIQALSEALEDHDDAQNVTHNADFPPSDTA